MLRYNIAVSQDTMYRRPRAPLNRGIKKKKEIKVHLTLLFFISLSLSLSLTFLLSHAIYLSGMLLSIFLFLTLHGEKRKYFKQKNRVLAGSNPSQSRDGQVSNLLRHRYKLIKILIFDLYQILFLEGEKRSKSIFPKCGNTRGPSGRQYII
jgi:hypothetical protein